MGVLKLCASDSGKPVADNNVLELVPTVPDTNERSVASVPDHQGTLLKYKADRGPVAYVMVVFAVHLGIWALAAPWICAIAVIPLVLLGNYIVLTRAGKRAG